MSEVTRILQSMEEGNSDAGEELLPLVYEELRKRAAHMMANEAAGHTLQATALVHEAWVRLAGNQQQDWKKSRRYFFGAAAEAMRRILIDNARRKKRVVHGGGLTRVDLDGVDLAATTTDETLLRLDEALAKLIAEDKEKAELVKLRFFVGLSIPQAANELGWSERKAKESWAYARAFLYDELTRGA